VVAASQVATIAGPYLVLSTYGTDLDLYRLDADGGLDPAGTYYVPNLSNYGTAIVTAAGDLNGDGVADLLVANDRQLSVWLNQGPDGGFGLPLTATLGTPGYYLTIAVGDLNGDGRPDVAVSGTSHDQGSTFGTDILLNECAQ
jgi:hypothetical protein